ncbi:serine/threonine-protein kinase-like protein CCR1 [Magnolia sinica]|uniref:serine/threonine-protein kinase-like protein CCR1 n=1 Tax=Magnolia sinica TaxID=86752 RepID=UPI00265A907E|nr:serine/threonine-protein kinase-like protein CCR1 [Magnolia sinica]
MAQEIEPRSQIQSLFLLLLVLIPTAALAFGSMGPIAAAFGDPHGFFCAIEASGKQEVVCWEKNGSTQSAQAFFSSIPPMAALSGGDGFMCGLYAETSRPYCWNSRNSGTDLVPENFQNSTYSCIAAGKNHVCAVKGSYYDLRSDSGMDFGNVDCWVINGNTTASSSGSKSSDFSPPVKNLAFGEIVSGQGFTCGESRELGFLCWGPNSKNLGVSAVSGSLVSVASGRNSVCAILRDSGEVRCWGEAASFVPSPPTGTRFVGLAAGSHHFCGIREDDHGIECWGNFNESSVPKGSGFLVIAASDFTTCGVREDDLILDCWGGGGLLPSSSSLDYSPPLQLCSPGLCTAEHCGEGEFSFNVSALNVPDLASLCVHTDLRICSSCGSNCSEGFFTSSVCGENANRVCTACSLCQNSTCWDICGFSSTDSVGVKQRKQWVKKLVIAIGSSVLGCFALVLIGWCLLPRLILAREGRRTGKSQCTMCVGNMEKDADNNPDPEPVFPVLDIAAQVFRLSELKDATNSFKEFNELGRGSYGIVYKAILSDGRQVAVKRANAATRINSNSRDFEADLEILCKVRHCNLVNLLGYCAEMGERLLVYEYMPHGTLHDHLHSGLSPLDWNLRLKISMQAARGLEYLHKDAVPPIVHRDIKASNILLDSEWGARVADFELLSTGERALNGESVYVDPGYHKTQAFTEKSDVYSFGVVLLEILSGRKGYDKDYTPPSIVEWAVPLISRGKAAAVIDRNVSLPRNVEPLLRLAEIAELTVREDPHERPIMSDVAAWLEQIVKSACFT